MSVSIKYKGAEIASANTDTTKTLKTSGKYCEGDIEVINTQDGGITPSGSLDITENGTYDVTEYAEAVVDVSGGGSGDVETGEVYYHTGEVVAELAIPISAEMANHDNLVVAVYPIKTWALNGEEWVERDSLDFTGITGFKSGKWNPLLTFLVGMSSNVMFGTSTISNEYCCGRGMYSNNVAGNYFQGTFSYSDNALHFTSFNGAKVCVADGGLTFSYKIWGWDNA